METENFAIQFTGNEPDTVNQYIYLYGQISLYIELRIYFKILIKIKNYIELILQLLLVLKNDFFSTSRIFMRKNCIPFLIRFKSDSFPRWDKVAQVHAF